MKTSFVLHNDSLFILDELTDEQAGQLFKAIKAYHLGQEYQLDFALNLVFILFKNQFERDNENYIKRCNRNAENGSKGGRPKKAKQTEKTQSVISKPKKADSDNDSDNEKDSDIIYRKNSFAESLKPYLEKYGREMIREFFLYWTEPNQKNTKMKYELEKTWSLERRLNTWSKQSVKFGTEVSKAETPKFNPYG